MKKSILFSLAVGAVMIGMCSVSFAAVDHSIFIQQYEGAKTCAGCHPGLIEEIQQTSHYQFQTKLPENYLFDEEGNPSEIEVTGKLWKLCGFPTAIPQSNWLGKLKDDPETAHIDVPGGCAKCHIGIGFKPFSVGMKDAPDESEAYNVDCLICHSSTYKRKFYVSMVGGEPELNAIGSPIVFIAPRIDGVFDFSAQLADAQSVGPTSAATCNRCHSAAGGGRVTLDDMEYSLKRGAVFNADADVHAAAGMSCSTCHSAGEHQVKRSPNNDTWAYDNLVETELCIGCHTATPHGEASASYNNHTSFVSCTTCHASSQGGAVYKDFSDMKLADPADPLALNKVRVDKVTAETFQMEYHWFNGQVQGELEPMGGIGDGKIFPYKRVAFNQPVDENGHPVPLKWGKIFVAADFEGALATGRSMYDSYVTEEMIEKTSLSATAGEFVGFKESSPLFSESHGITKVNALTCESCHNQNSVLDFEGTLGYSTERASELQDLFGTGIQDWALYNN